MNHDNIIDIATYLRLCSAAHKRRVEGGLQADTSEAKDFQERGRGALNERPSWER
jgi:ribosomal protein L15E